MLKSQFHRAGDALAWNLATRVPLVERLAQPAPGDAGWMRVAVRGATFRMPDNIWWADTFVHGWEAKTLAIYRMNVRSGDTVVDAGAWIGPTVMFACACRAARVLAIEPNPACRPHLTALVDSARRLGTEVTVCTTGVFSSAGEAAFGTRYGVAVASSEASLGGTGTHVPVAPLPELMRANGVTAPDFVKIDIEGTEFAIADQIASLERTRVFLSLHPPLAPVGVDKQALVDALARFDLYDIDLQPLAHAALAARVFSTEARPAWGMTTGNFFEVLLVPRGEPPGR
jgi:FkbM family methyltransferase